MSTHSDTVPSLAAFLAQHAHPYDAARDTYRRPPFAAPVKAGKNTAIYNAHSYHTKVPPQGIVPYIEHYTEPGDLVLDPFCGSGMTGVAALLSGRHAVLNDLSPAAVHIARNYCTPVDVDALRAEFERIKAAVQEEFDWLYGTTCDRCHGPATIQYTIWSDVFACDRCGEALVLWDVAVDRHSGKVLENFWPDPRSGRWRVPTDSEREKMSSRQSLADEAHLRTVRRYLAGQLDRRPNDWELSEWLRFCYRREAYAEAVALFPHFHPDHLEPERYAELKKIVAVCRLRAGN